MLSLPCCLLLSFMTLLRVSSLSASRLELTWNTFFFFLNNIRTEYVLRTVQATCVYEYNFIDPQIAIVRGLDLVVVFRLEYQFRLGLSPLALTTMSSAYKKQKEEFVSGMTGSTVTHINLVSCAALVRRSPTVLTAVEPVLRYPYSSTTPFKPEFQRARRFPYHGWS